MCSGVPTACNHTHCPTCCGQVSCATYGQSTTNATGTLMGQSSMPVTHNISAFDCASVIGAISIVCLITYAVKLKNKLKKFAV